MYCRNCGNEVNEKAIACTKCGVDPNREKSFCHTCGVKVNENQIMCIACGGSLKSKGFNIDLSQLPNVSNLEIPKVDFAVLFSKKSNILMAVAFVGCLLPWVSINVFGVSQSFSAFGISKFVDSVPNTILFSFLILILPITIIGYLISDLIIAIKPYKDLLLKVSLGLVIYVGIGFILAKTSSPSSINSGNASVDQMFGSIQQAASDAVSISFGYFVTLAGVIGSFLLKKS